jgi:glycosyltransferase involved in cell wall biosynthesis
VVTVHDVIPMVMRDQVKRSLKNRMFPLYRRVMTEVGARADAIITDSAASRVDVLRHLRIPRDREGVVHVVHCGVAPGFLVRPDGGGACDVPREKTVLYVGRADPYKNLVVLVEAFARMRRTIAGPVVLQIVGPPDPRYPEAAERARALGVWESVRWTGYVADAELARLYSVASVLVLPSRYEGFGLPVVEAMASGTPVVCSDIPVLREVAGDAAAFVGLDDAAALSAALQKVLTDRRYADGLRERGLARARAFTWEETARKTLEVYASAVAGRRADV